MLTLKVSNDKTISKSKQAESLETKHYVSNQSYSKLLKLRKDILLMKIARMSLFIRSLDLKKSQSHDEISAEIIWYFNICSTANFLQKLFGLYKCVTQTLKKTKIFSIHKKTNGKQLANNRLVSIMPMYGEIFKKNNLEDNNQ